LKGRIGSHTFEDMRKDAVITVRVPRPTRRRLQCLARREGRSLSQQIERLIERGLDEVDGGEGASATGSTAGMLAGEPVPDYKDFREVRTFLSASLLRRARRRGAVRR
jgi:Ribbon-helix-helix protein, copG family